MCGAPPKREPVHVEKEKTGNNVCGAPPKGNLHTSKRKKQEITCAEPPPPSRSTPKKETYTRQKEKSKERRVRSRPPAIPEPPKREPAHVNNKKIELLGTFSNPTASYLYREHVTVHFESLQGNKKQEE